MITLLKWAQGLTALLAGIALAMSIQPAHAGDQPPANRNYSPQCTTRGEFQSVDTFDSRNLVRRVFDVRGRRVGGEEVPRVQAWSFKACKPARADRFGVVFHRENGVWRLTDKYREVPF